MDGVNSIQSGIKLQCIPKYYRIQSKWEIATYKKKQNISQARNQKHGKYDPTLDLKRCDHIWFDMLGSNFCLDCRYCRYVDSKVK